MIVVTTPTGQIGARTVRQLLDQGKPVRVIARDSGALDERTRAEAEVIEGSHGDDAVVDQALDGAEALLWIAPPTITKSMDDAYVVFTRPAERAIRRHGVKRVVSVTALGRGTIWQDRAGLVTASIAMDDLLMSTGAAFRGLAMPSFMENNTRQAASMRDSGLFFGPLDSDRKVPWTATRDMASTAARLLVDDGWSGQEELPVIGPDDLSMDEIAAIASELTGRDVRYQQISFDAFKQQVLDRGATESFAQGYVDMYRAKNEGMDNVAEVAAANRALTTFRQWAEQDLRPLMVA